MKKLFLSLFTIGVVSAVAIGATRAYFTDTEILGANSISTGKLDVQLRGNYTEGIVIPVDTTQSFQGGMVPGETFGPYAIEVYNQGWGVSTVPVKYAWSVENNTGSQLLFDKINVKVREGNCDWITAGWFTEPQGVLYTGPLATMPLTQSANQLDPNITRCTWFYFSLPTDAGNEYQGLNTVFDLRLSATQTTNPGWTE